MSIISDNQRNNDPRLKENVVPPSPPPVQPNTLPAGLPQESPQQSLETTPIFGETPIESQETQYSLGESPLPTDASFIDTPNPDDINPILPPPQPGIDSSMSVLGGGLNVQDGEIALPPITPTQQEEGEPQEPNYQVPEGFGTQKPIQLQVIEQQLQQQQLEQQNKPYEEWLTGGDIRGGVYETSENFKTQMEENSNAWYNSRRQSIFEAERSLRQKVTQPRIPDKPQVGSGNFDPDPLRNPLSNDDKATAGNWIQESLYQLGRFGQALGFRGDGKTFDPWYGAKNYIEEVKRNPQALLQSPLLPFIVGSTGKYGEFGEGYAGMLMYLLSLPQSVVVGGATDVHNVLTGNYDRKKTPNIIQGLVGKAFDFSQERSPEKPLSVVGKNTTPKTFTELEQRSIIYGNPGTKITFAALRKIYGDKIPDWVQKAMTHPDGGTWLRAPEFIAGLAADVVFPDPGDVGKIFNPRTYAKLSPPPKVTGEAQELASKIKPDRPQAIPPLPPEAPKPDVPVKPQQLVPDKSKAPGYAIGSPKYEAVARLHSRKPPIINNVPVVPPPSQIVKSIITEGGTVDPMNVIGTVVRSNEDLTKLAIANGDYAGQIPLNKKRLDLLAQSDPIYSRIGAPIPDEVRQAIELSNPSKKPDMTIQEAIENLNQIGKQMSNPDLTPDDLFQLSQRGEELAAIATDTPDVIANPKRLNEVHQFLPESQRANTQAGIEVTQRLLNLETKYTEASEIAAQAAKEHETVVEELANYLDNMDDLAPDLGRRVIQEEIPYSVTEPQALPVDDFDLESQLQALGKPSEIPDIGDIKLPGILDKTYGDEDTYAYLTKYMSQEEASPIVDYINSIDNPNASFNPFEINRQLRRGVEGVDTTPLDNALNKLPPYEGQVVRGQSRRLNVKPGDVYTDAGFMSTSRAGESKYVYENMPTQLVINSKTGRDIGNLDENEILFPRNSRFLVDSVEEVNGKQVVRLTELAAEPQVLNDLINTRSQDIELLKEMGFDIEDDTPDFIIDNLISEYVQKSPNVEDLPLSTNKSTIDEYHPVDPSQWKKYDSVTYDDIDWDNLDSDSFQQIVDYGKVLKEQIDVSSDWTEVPIVYEAISRLDKYSSSNQMEQIFVVPERMKKFTSGGIDLYYDTMEDAQEISKLIEAVSKVSAFYKKIGIPNVNTSLLVNTPNFVQNVRPEFRRLLSELVINNAEGIAFPMGKLFILNGMKKLFDVNDTPTIVHEIAHKLHHLMPDPEKYAQDILKLVDGEEAITEYSKKNGYERIAELMQEMYVNPERIITQYPKHYEAFKKIVKDLSGNSNQLDVDVRKPLDVDVRKPWYHGSKVRDLDLTKADPLIGGSRGEFGTAIYFTDNLDDAVDYAKAEPSKNVPKLDERIFDEVGNVYETDIKINNPLEATRSLPDEARNAINRIWSNELNVAYPTLSKRFRRYLNKDYYRPMQDLYNRIDELILDEYGYYPEEVGLDIFRRMNNELRNLGYDAIRSTGDDGNTVLAYIGKPGTGSITVNSTTAHGTGDLLEQALHRYNADTKSASRLPKNSQAKANAVDSTANLLYRIGERTGDEAKRTADEAERLARELLENQYKLEEVVEIEKQKKQIQRLQQAQKADDEMIRHNNKVDDNPCL